MPSDSEQQRQILRGVYAEGVIRNYERLAESPSEHVRLSALRRLAQIIGIIRVLPQLYDLACEAQSDRIALRANNLIADYLRIGSDASADDRPEPLRFSLNEQLAAERQTSANQEPHQQLSRQPRAAVQFTLDPVQLPEPPPELPPLPPRTPPVIPEAWREDWSNGKRPKPRKPAPEQPGNEPPAAKQAAAEQPGTA